VEQLAERLGTSLPTAYRRVKSGAIPSWRSGMGHSSIWIRESDVTAYLADHPPHQEAAQRPQEAAQAPAEEQVNTRTPAEVRDPVQPVQPVQPAAVGAPPTPTAPPAPTPAPQPWRPE
jgi:excisionase family DNA binding protein